MSFKGESNSQKNWSQEKKLEYDLSLHKELNELYELITKMVIVCLRKNIKIMIENPYSDQHYLTRYWSLKPTFVDKDRTTSGDYFKKPTQYWFINCKPSFNFIFEPMEITKKYNVEFATKTEIDGVMCSQKTFRSMIAPCYASRFIRENLIYEQINN